MIVKPAGADRYVVHPPETLAAALVFGPDQGLVGMLDRIGRDQVGASVLDRRGNEFAIFVEPEVAGVPEIRHAFAGTGRLQVVGHRIAAPSDPSLSTFMPTSMPFSS